MAFNLQTLSITSAFNSIVSFFRSQENNSKWRDLTTGSEGSFLIRMLANIFSAISYRIVAQSRENYLTTAALQSSTTGIAVNLGYSVFRGSNVKRSINITPTETKVIPKLGLIGAYSEDYGIWALEDVALEAGVPIDIKVVVGAIGEEQFTAGTNKVKCFSRFTSGISEDYTLYLGSKEVPTSNIITDMDNDMYLVRTNPYMSVDIMYLNNKTGAQYVYGTESVFTLRYIKLEDIDVQAFSDDMITVGTLNGQTNVSTYLPFESAEETKIYAPLDHETQHVIRSKQDYANRLNGIIHATTNVGYKALTPTYTLLTYLKNDFTLLTAEEKSQISSTLDQERFFGTPLPDVSTPRREVANLDIRLKLNTKYKNVADINTDIQNILLNYYDAQLGTTFNTYDLERKIEDLTYVRYARVSHVINTRDADTNYQVGYILNKEDQYYIASKILGLSGSKSPSWNIPILNPPAEIDTGLETKDGGLIWRTYKWLPGMPANTMTPRQNNMQYGIGDYVYDTDNAPNYMFKCVDIVKSSGFSEPDASNVVAKDFIIDGNIVWVAKERSDTYNVWASSTVYHLGDSVNISSSTDYSFECISYTGTTSTEEESTFDFELPVYDILESSTNSFTVAGNKTFYFRPEDGISATWTGGRTSFSVKNSIFNGVNTVITVTSDIPTINNYTTLYTLERGTKDGQILWTLVDDINNLEYPWNGYVVFAYNVGIIE